MAKLKPEALAKLSAIECGKFEALKPLAARRVGESVCRVVAKHSHGVTVETDAGERYFVHIGQIAD